MKEESGSSDNRDSITLQAEQLNAIFRGYAAHRNRLRALRDICILGMVVDLKYSSPRIATLSIGDVPFILQDKPCHPHYKRVLRLYLEGLRDNHQWDMNDIDCPLFMPISSRVDARPEREFISVSTNKIIMAHIKTKTGLEFTGDQLTSAEMDMLDLDALIKALPKDKSKPSKEKQETDVFEQIQSTPGLNVMDTVKKFKHPGRPRKTNPVVSRPVLKEILTGRDLAKIAFHKVHGHSNVEAMKQQQSRKEQFPALQPQRSVVHHDGYAARRPAEYPTHHANSVQPAHQYGSNQYNAVASNPPAQYASTKYSSPAHYERQNISHTGTIIPQREPTARPIGYRSPPYGSPPRAGTLEQGNKPGAWSSDPVAYSHQPQPAQKGLFYPESSLAKYAYASSGSSTTTNASPAMKTLSPSSLNGATHLKLLAEQPLTRALEGIGLESPSASIIFPQRSKEVSLLPSEGQKRGREDEDVVLCLLSMNKRPTLGARN
jgi:hypothetical protein